MFASLFSSGDCCSWNFCAFESVFEFLDFASVGLFDCKRDLIDLVFIDYSRKFHPQVGCRGIIEIIETFAGIGDIGYGLLVETE